jgi:hypothetical protein
MILEPTVPSGMTRYMQVRSWFSSLSSVFVPRSTDPLVAALITNDSAVLSRDAADISPYLPLLMQATGPVPEQVPDFIGAREYRLAGSVVPAATFWHLCFADVSVLAPLNLGWLVSFAIYFWKCPDQSDPCAVFDGFCQTRNHPRDDGDPVYALLRHRTRRGPTAADVASLLPPIDGHFFLSIFKAVDHQEYDLVLSAALCAEQLLSAGVWTFAVCVLMQLGLEDEANQILAGECSPSSQLTQDERWLVHECRVREDVVWEAKVTRIRYTIDFLDRRAQLEMYNTLISLLISTEKFDDAYEALFAEYVPLMTELGRGGEEALKWSHLLLDKLADADQLDDCRVLDGYRRVLAGERLSRDEIDVIGRKLMGKWQSFALRRELCTVLIGQEGAYDALKGVDAVPKDRLRVNSP